MPRTIKAKVVAKPTTPSAPLPNAANPVRVVVAAASTPIATPSVVVPAAPAAPVIVEPDASAKEAERKIEQRLKEQIDEVKEFKTMITGMCNQWIDNLTDAQREIKLLRRTQKKPRPANVSGPKKPSTFEQKRVISDKLCTLFAVPSGTEMSRNDVTHHFHLYCKKHNLLQEGDHRIINPNAALMEVLAPIPENERLTFFNLQRYLKPNYE